MTLRSSQWMAMQFLSLANNSSTMGPHTTPRQLLSSPPIKTSFSTLPREPEGSLQASSRRTLTKKWTIRTKGSLCPPTTSSPIITTWTSRRWAQGKSTLTSTLLLLSRTDLDLLLKGPRLLPSNLPTRILPTWALSRVLARAASLWRTLEARTCPPA